jgi:hypothetical protein
MVHELYNARNVFYYELFKGSIPSFNTIMPPYDWDEFHDENEYYDEYKRIAELSDKVRTFVNMKDI